MTDIETSDWTNLAFPARLIGDGNDVLLTASAKPPPVFINGKKKADLIDGTHAPAGQPFASGADDIIDGRGGKDRLFGLGGDDTLDGGKDKDKLFGGDGEDLFLFSVGLRKNAPDKIMDFVTVDDTILLAVSKFQGLCSRDRIRSGVSRCRRSRDRRRPHRV